MGPDKKSSSKPQSWRTKSQAKMSDGADYIPEQSLLNNDSSPSKSWRSSDFQRTILERVLLWTSRLFITSATIGVLVFLVQLLLTLHRPIPIVTAFATNYQAPFGPLPLVEEDKKLLLDLNSPGNGFFAPMAATVSDISSAFGELTTGTDFMPYITRTLKEARPGGPDRNTVLVYITAIAAIDKTGKPFLVPPLKSAQPLALSDADFISVERLLAGIRAAVQPNINVVTVLDCGKDEQSWPSGLAGTGFPAAVETIVDQGNHDRLWVMLPYSAGQRILTSEYLGGSSFTTHFARGLQGVADAKPYGNSDGQVSLLELSQYLQNKVDHFATTVFGSRQTPKLLGTSSPGLKTSIKSDSVMLSWSKGPRGTLNIKSLSIPDISWLTQRWNAVDEIRKLRKNTRPVLWGTYQNLLLRSERLRHYGIATSKIQGVNDAFAEQLESRLQRPITSLEYVLLDQELAQLTESPESDQRAELEAIDKLLEDSKQSVATTTGDINVWQDRLKQAWQLLLLRMDSGKDISRPYLRRWLDYVGPSPDNDSFSSAQLHFIRMLLEWSQNDAWSRSPSLFPKLIQCVADSRNIAIGRSRRLHSSLADQRNFKQAMDMLRRAIDLTFVGDSDSMRDAVDLAAQVHNDFKVLKSELTRRWQVLKTLDQLNSELPYLLDWWTREAQIQADQQKTSTLQPIFIEELLTSCRRYYRSFRSLAMLASPAERDSQKQFTFIEKYQQAADKNFKKLLNSYLDHCRNLAAAAPDSPQTLGAIRRALLTPLIPAGTRIQLLMRSNQLEQQLIEEYAKNFARVTKPIKQSTESNFEQGSVRVDGSFSFPVTAQFLDDVPQQNRLPSSTEEFAAYVGLQSSVLRKVSRNFDEDFSKIKTQVNRAAQQNSDNSKTLLAILEGASVDNRRHALLVCDQLKFITGKEHDPEITYFANLTYRRLIRLSELTLDDFWNAIAPGSEPFCLVKSRRLLSIATIVTDKYGAKRDDLLEQEFEERLSDAEVSIEEFSRIELSPRRITLAPLSSDLPASLSIKLEPSSPGIPGGVATVWLAPGAESEPLPTLIKDSSSKPITQLPVCLYDNTKPESWKIDAAISRRLEENEVPALDFVVWYRGHKMVQGVPVVSATASRMTQWHTQSSDLSKITVHGDASQTQAVAIIFDCSGSMGRRMMDGRTRLDAGRAAVQQVLDNLVSAGDWDVSLWLYGHRTQWSRDEKGNYSSSLTDLGQKAKDTAKKNDQPFNLVPGDDVEQVLPMQPLTQGVALEIDSILSPISPGGETPLYRAISEAIGTDFDGSHSAIPGHVLVVTDGANDQSGGQFTTAPGVTRQLAQKNLRRSIPLRIDIIGFALESNGMERAMRMAEVRDVAHNSGGKFYEATDPAALLKSLRDSFRLLQWRVSGPNAVNKTLHLEETCTLPRSIPRSIVNYDAFLETGPRPPSRRFAAENNTSLDLYVTNGGRSIEFRRYDGGTEQGLRDSKSGLVDPIDSRRKSFFGVHLASRTMNDVRIPISIQNDEANSYSQRPTSIWVEVQPLKQDKPIGIPYTFYDMTLQKNRSVPVFDLIAPQWPPLATKALVKAWFRFDQVNPDLLILVNDLSEEVEKEFSFPGLPGSKILVTRKKPQSKNIIEVSVVEEHPAEQSSHLPLLKAVVSGASLSASHMVEPDICRIRHTFLIQATNGRISDNVRLEFTDQQRLIAGATSTISDGGMPLVIPIPAQ